VDAPDSTEQRRRRSAASWLHEQRLSQAAADSAGGEMQDQWLRSAETTFPQWYILNQVKKETRMLLYYTLPLPHWFAARLF